MTQFLHVEIIKWVDDVKNDSQLRLFHIIICSFSRTVSIQNLQFNRRWLSDDIMSKANVINNFLID